MIWNIIKFLVTALSLWFVYKVFFSPPWDLVGVGFGVFLVFMSCMLWVDYEKIQNQDGLSRKIRKFGIWLLIGIFTVAFVIYVFGSHHGRINLNAFVQIISALLKAL